MILILCVFGYLSPWVIHPAGGLTFHAYDLAEWASLHPIVRAESPALFTTMLLRLPLVAIGVLFALSAHRGRRWRVWCWVAAFGVALGLLPPFDFVTQLSNGNYQQQLGLALMVIVALVLSITGRFVRIYPIIGAATALIGFLSGVIGFVYTLDLLHDFDLATAPGMGVFFTNIALILFLLTLYPRPTASTQLVPIGGTGRKI